MSSYWSRWTRYTAAPKKPPPEHGIKLKKAGATWWGQRWIDALHTVLRGDSGRLARGRTYARAGRTHDLVVKGGKVTAKVTGSRATPYKIAIELPQLADAVWKKAIAGMAEKAQFSAELLAGQMPQQIDEVFQAAGTSLFPQNRSDLVTSCSCPDWGDPCKHVAATHYVLGEALDRDPFLLFELRGRTKDQVLAALRSARSAGAEEEPAAAGPRPKGRKKAIAEAKEPELPAVAAVTLGALTAESYDAPRGALPALLFSFDAAVSHGAILRQLGAPPGWEDPRPPASLLGPLIQAAAETARQIALAEPGDEAPEEAASGGDATGAKASTRAAPPTSKRAKTRKPPSRAKAR